MQSIKEGQRMSKLCVLIKCASWWCSHQKGNQIGAALREKKEAEKESL